MPRTPSKRRRIARAEKLRNRDQRETSASGSTPLDQIRVRLADEVGRPELSNRERQVLEYLANGKSNKEIGAILCITGSTVKGHIRAILEKLEAKGRSEAITTAVQRGIIPAVTNQHLDSWSEGVLKY